MLTKSALTVYERKGRKTEKEEEEGKDNPLVLLVSISTFS